LILFESFAENSGNSLKYSAEFNRARSDIKLRTLRDTPKYANWTEANSIPQSRTYLNYYSNICANNIQIRRLEIGQ
jgi:hypothetical protein